MQRPRSQVSSACAWQRPLEPAAFCVKEQVCSDFASLPPSHVYSAWIRVSSDRARMSCPCGCFRRQSSVAPVVCRRRMKLGGALNTTKGDGSFRPKVQVRWSVGIVIHLVVAVAVRSQCSRTKRRIAEQKSSCHQGSKFMFFSCSGSEVVSEKARRRVQQTAVLKYSLHRSSLLGSSLRGVRPTAARRRFGLEGCVLWGSAAASEAV